MGTASCIDESGRAVTEPGRRGEIVGTGFINDLLPFIRYRTGDFARYAGDRCGACGREMMLFTDIEGRGPEVGLLARDGSVISLTASNLHDDTLHTVADFQFRQRYPGKALLCIVPAVSLTQEQEEDLRSRVEKSLQGQIQIELRVVTRLYKTRMGKQPRIVREIGFDPTPRVACEGAAEKTGN